MLEIALFFTQLTNSQQTRRVSERTMNIVPKGGPQDGNNNKNLSE
jgi:hypothetical protein